MTEGRPIRAFDYVNQPYDVVSAALRRDAARIVERATKMAADRGKQLLASLSVEVGGLEIRKDVAIEVGPVKSEDGTTLYAKSTTIPLSWKARDMAALFPVMRAELKIYPLSHGETQVELSGRYEPPMGMLGGALDLALGHRIAEASVDRFVREIAVRLREELGAKALEGTT